jgi:hypothetical protein
MPESIVAIHGLDGDREISWMVLWLRDLLPKEIPYARTLSYGYNANTRGSVSRKLMGHGNQPCFSVGQLKGRH